MKPTVINQARLNKVQNMGKGYQFRNPLVALKLQLQKTSPCIIMSHLVFTKLLMQVAKPRRYLKKATLQKDSMTGIMVIKLEASKLKS